MVNYSLLTSEEKMQFEYFYLLHENIFLENIEIYEAIYNLNFLILNDFFFFIPECYFFIFLLFLFTSNIIIGNSKCFNYPSLLKISIYSGAFLFLMLLFLISSTLNLDFSVFIFNNQFCVNQFLTLFKILLLFSSFIFCFMSLKYIEIEKFKNYEFAMLIFFSIFGMYLLIGSNNMLTFYLSLELQTLCLFGLASYKRFSNFSVEAGMKYFILGGFSSGILLFGISLIYGISGLINFNDISLFLIFLYDSSLPNFLDLKNYSYGMFLGFFFILIALFFKLGLAPFHIWVVDVYEGAPTIITAFFSIITKIGIIAIIFKCVNSFLIYMPSSFFFNLVVICGLLSLFIGTFGALVQTKIKRILAFSTISHVGYMILGFSVLNFNGFFSIFFYLIVYVIVSLGLFTIILTLKRHRELKIKNITDLRGIKTTNNFITLAFILSLFSLAGIPPLAGFFSKFFIFMALVEAQMYFEIFFALLMSVIGAFYYLRLIKIIVFNNNKKDYDFYFEIKEREYVIIGFSLIFNCYFYLIPLKYLNLIFEFVYSFANSVVI